MTLLSGPVVLDYDLIFVLLELPAEVNNQILEKNKLKAMNKDNQYFFVGHPV